MNNLLLVGGIALCLPLTTLADPSMETDLNGLAIDVALSLPPIHALDASAVSRGASQILKLTNRSGQAVQCRVEPGVADAMRPLGRTLRLGPGSSALMLVDSRPIGRSTDARLSCTPERDS
ncbi:hypothetical protein [Metapseudomonas resinovorans]|uniref:3-phosphoglycerate kinase n=1 Tax=Metapseudomonas resinovorans NBRC 106553 TaxID=1245471 RepID=S6AIM4_METRE|nr:hypothetical protein [Pseudomonas resinovorans]BAN50502.1 hypothetical protein PCA10_47700 [Pseudomonas resinovorans NBRC 106553]